MSFFLLVAIFAVCGFSALLVLETDVSFLLALISWEVLVESDCDFRFEAAFGLRLGLFFFLLSLSLELMQQAISLSLHLFLSFWFGWLVGWSRSVEGVSLDRLFEGGIVGGLPGDLQAEGVFLRDL